MANFNKKSKSRKIQKYDLKNCLMKCKNGIYEGVLCNICLEFCCKFCFLSMKRYDKCLSKSHKGSIFNNDLDYLECKKKICIKCLKQLKIVKFTKNYYNKKIYNIIKYFKVFRFKKRNKIKCNVHVTYSIGE